jgi:hypothetical protein
MLKISKKFNEWQKEEGKLKRETKIQDIDS